MSRLVDLFNLAVDTSIDTLLYEYNNHPYHLLIELLFVLFILYLLPQKSFKWKTKPEGLTEKEIDQLCAEWTPEPLFTPTATSEVDSKIPIIDGAVGPHVNVGGKDLLNLASFNFLGFVKDKEIERACEDCIRKYGVGSCGPRGFYGTIDVHLELEDRITKFLGTEQTILYSYGFATVSSTIPAFCKRGDLIICDDGVNAAVATGVDLSRSHAKFFKHNDMASLKACLDEVKKQDLKKPPKELNRRFIVIEGLYQNHGDIAPLNHIVKLAQEYCFRIILDDSFGFGVLGKTGRGTPEHFGIPMSAIDIYTACIGQSLSSVGGFCTGSHMVVDHQRLSGSGYCFSASLPPFLAKAATTAIDKLDRDPSIVQRLSVNCELAHKEIQDTLNKIPGCIVKVETAPCSPLFHIRLVRSTGTRVGDEEILQKIVDMAAEKGLLLTRAKYNHRDKLVPSASIRVSVSAGHTPQEIKSAVKTLAGVVQAVGKDFTPAL